MGFIPFFGLLNKSNKTWGVLISATNGTLEFAFGVAEEITLNITGISNANATEIPEAYNLLPSVKDAIPIASTSIGIASKITQPTLFGVIAGATQNLSPFI